MPIAAQENKHLLTLVDPGGICPHPLWGAPHNGTQFFSFHMQFCQKVPAPDVSTPYGIGTPSQREILDPPLTINACFPYSEYK